MTKNPSRDLPSWEKIVHAALGVGDVDEDGEEEVGRASSGVGGGAGETHGALHRALLDGEGGDVRGGGEVDEGGGGGL